MAAAMEGQFEIGQVVRIADVVSTRNPRRDEQCIAPGKLATVVKLAEWKKSKGYIVVAQDAPKEGTWSFDENELEAAS